jgi:cytochrome c2
MHEPSKFVPGTIMPTWSDVIPEKDFPKLIAYVHELEKKAGKAD